MQFALKYLEKQDRQYFVAAPGNLTNFDMIVVIPCFNEPGIENTIQSLFACNNPGVSVAIVVVVNNSINAHPKIEAQNKISLTTLALLNQRSPGWISLYTIESMNLPEKHAGVGWARKIGMDWAVSHYNATEKPKGIIVSLDADTLVEINYLESILSFYKQKTNAIGATIYFEHPIDNSETGIAITWYELYMRYYKYAMAFAGFPHPIYTVGSCFTITAKAYVSQGGMNRRKAGEDFYFLHKMTQLGNLGEINNTIVHPSARVSDRVPFGTGHAMQQYFKGTDEYKHTYPLEAFVILKDFFGQIGSYYRVKPTTYENLSENKTFIEFLQSINFIDELHELVANCSTIAIFEQRFFQIFNAFKILKWLNYALLNGYNKSDLLIEIHKLLTAKKIKPIKGQVDPNLMLKLFRQMDKAQSFV